MTDKQFKESIRPILDCIDKIRIHLHDIGIQTPCICSVGCQSAGKSSVLESITGIQLPRGEGTVTRCPILIQLRNAKKKEFAKVKYGSNEWKIISIEDIAKTLSDLQTELLKSEGDPVLTSTSIQLEVERNNASDLTLIDLPGITHKDDETYTKISNIIVQYLKPKATIALLVHSSTADFDANECLSLIRKIADDGRNDIFERTIPIFTKPDDALKTNPGTLLKNLKIGKELGFYFDPILVLNRNQEQIDKNVDNEKIRKLETDLFNNPIIKDVCSSNHGIANLIGILVQIQKEKLISSLPKIRQCVKEKINEYNESLSKFPKGCKNRKEFNKFLRQYCDDYDRKMKDTLINVNSYLSKEPSKKKCLETRIREQFKDFKKRFTEQIYKYLSEDFYERIDLIVKDSIRLNPENFYGEETWNNVIHEEIRGVFNDCPKLIDNISKMIEEEVKGPFDEAFKFNKGFHNKAQQILEDLIETNKKNCNNYFDIIKNIECDRNFSLNERYIDYVNRIYNKIIIIKDGNEKMKKKPEKKEEQEKDENIEKQDKDEEEVKDKNNIEIDNSFLLKDEKEENFFYFYTNLDKELFLKFANKLVSSEKKKIDMNNIKIMCSIFSYLKIFLDRFLDYLDNGILYYLLKSFINNNFTNHLKYEFADLDDKTCTNIMGGDTETRNKIEKIERKKFDLENAYQDLMSL